MTGVVMAPVRVTQLSCSAKFSNCNCNCDGACNSLLLSDSNSDTDGKVNCVGAVERVQVIFCEAV